MAKASSKVKLGCFLIVLAFFGGLVYIGSAAHDAAIKTEQERRAKLAPEQRAAEDAATAKAAEAKRQAEQAAAAEKLKADQARQEQEKIERAERDRQRKIDKDKIDAEVEAKDVIRNCLHFPDDAKFPWFSGSTETNEQGDLFLCRGKVNAKNGFGAELTYSYAVLLFLEENTWKIVEVTIGDEVVKRDDALLARLEQRAKGLRPQGEAAAKGARPSRPPAAAAKPVPKPAPPQWRTWTDAAGEHTIEARFAGMIGDRVKLVKRSGEEVTLTLDKLSAKDQDWITGRH